MMRRNLKFFAAAFSLLALCASVLKAQDFNLNGIDAADIKALDTSGVPEPAGPAAPEAARDTKEWTVMVFMNAKNDLANSALFGLSGKWAEKDIAEMKKVGTTDKVNVVVDYGTAGKGARRMLVGKSGLFSGGETVYSRDKNADMGDYRRVIDFVKWSKKNFPSRRYMLILWNHGLGWLDPNMNRRSSGTGGSKGILFDVETKNYVRTRELGEILRQSGYVDVFAMNACLMQMAEVAYEIKDNTGLIVASEETMPAYGFDYTKLLNFMNSNPRADNEQISDFFIRWERDFIANGAHLIGPINLPLDSMPATISALRPKALDSLPAYLDAFAGAVMRNNETGAVKTAVAGAIRFTSLDPKNDKRKMLSAFTDLYDFARITGLNAKSPETARAAEALMGFIKNTLVIRSLGLNSDTVNGYSYSDVGGIAINMTMKVKTLPPQLESVFETRYGDLALSKASQWDEFVAWTDEVWRN